jgi:hypothetical protein
LKLGAAGGALLAAGGFVAWFAGRDATEDRHDVLVGAIGAVLDGALPADPADRAAAIDATLAGVEAANAGLAPAAAAAPTRLVLTGHTHSWREAGLQETAAVLQAWRTHRLALLRSAYQALHDLVTGAWYADERHWAAIGYPGPPSI